MKKITLYFLRHGKTFFNEKNLVQGWCDSLLIDEAKKEALLLREHLNQKDISFDYAYTSPMLRTRQTVQFVCPNVKVFEDARLMEINYGFLEGESAKTLQLFYPNRYDFKHFEGFIGGENWIEAGSRFQSCLDELVANAKNKDCILIVTHGAILTWFLNQIDGSINKKPDNLTLCKVIYDGKFQIEKIGV